LLLLYGFPSSSYDWRHHIQHFSRNGYGILALHLLGYGSTSKPLDAQAYKGKDMAKDVIEILDNANIDNANIQQVVGVGHDW